VDEEDDIDENEVDGELEPTAVEKKLDIIGAGSILNDMALLTGEDFYTNYVKCETDVQVRMSNMQFMVIKLYACLDVCHSKGRYS